MYWYVPKDIFISRTDPSKSFRKFNNGLGKEKDKIPPPPGPLDIWKTKAWLDNPLPALAAKPAGAMWEASTVDR